MKFEVVPEGGSITGMFIARAGSFGSTCLAKLTDISSCADVKCSLLWNKKQGKVEQTRPSIGHRGTVTKICIAEGDGQHFKNSTKMLYHHSDGGLRCGRNKGCQSRKHD